MFNTGDDIFFPEGKWDFNKKETVINFDQHIRRSIPFYEEAQQIIIDISKSFVDYDSIFFDIGCSTGSFTKKMHDTYKSKNIKSTGIDISKNMIQHAKDNYSDNNCRFVNADILDFDMADANIITSIYTIQFINPKRRQLIINKIYNQLNWGGAFFLFEKTRASDARFQDILKNSYYIYKLRQGYTQEQIFNKEMSLRGVLEPFSTKGNIDLLKRAGFIDINTIYKHLCFEGFLAIK